MTRTSKALLALSSLLPASLGAAVLAILLDVARNANDAREAAEHRESERRGERDEARSALAESERERLIAAGQVALLAQRLTDAMADCERLTRDLTATLADMEGLIKEGARENEQNTADRAAVERLKVEVNQADGCIGRHLHEKSLLRDQIEASRRDLAAAIARAEKAEADATQARTAEQAAYEREAAVGRRADAAEQARAALADSFDERVSAEVERSLALESRARLLAHTRNSEALAASERARADLAAELEAMRPDAESWRRQVASNAFLDDGQAPVHWSANDGRDYPCGLTVDTIGIGTWSGNRERATCPGCAAAPAEPVAAPPVGMASESDACVECGQPAGMSRVTREDSIHTIVACMACKGRLGWTAIRARYAARTLPPVAAATAEREGGT